MGNFTIYKLCKYYIQKYYVIIALAVIFAICGYYYETEVKVPMYKTEVSMLILQKQDKVVDINKYYENITLNKKLVPDYSKLLKSKMVLSKVKDNLGLNRKVESLGNKISVWTSDDSSMINFTVTDKKSEDAVTIANELAKVFKSEIKSLYNLDNVQIIDEATEEKSPNNIYVTRNTLLSGFIGVVLACGILFLYGFIKSKGDFDTMLVKKEKSKKEKKGKRIKGVKVKK